MGSLLVPVRELLSEPELVLDQWFHLDGASPESQVLLRAELKVRTHFLVVVRDVVVVVVVVFLLLPLVLVSLLNQFLLPVPVPKALTYLNMIHY